MPTQIATMSQPLILFGYQIVFEALDPDSLTAVTGVTIISPNLSGVNLSEDAPAASTALEVPFTPLDIQP